MKIKNRSRKQSHKLDGIGVGRIRTFPFLPIPFTTPSLMKTRLSELEAEAEEPTNRKVRSRTLSLVFSSASACDSDNGVSLDRKQRRHKQIQCSASDSVGLIFTRSYRSTLLITTPTTTPSLVKTSLKRGT